MQALIIYRRDDQKYRWQATSGFDSIGLAFESLGYIAVDRKLGTAVDNVLSLSSRGFDIVVLHVDPSNDWDAITKLVTIFKATGSRIILYVDFFHGTQEHLPHESCEVYHWLLNDIADCILAISSAAQEHMQVMVDDPNKVLCLGTPVNIDLIEKHYGNSEVECEPDLAYLGYFVQYQHENAICMMKLLQRLGYKGLAVAWYYTQNPEQYDNILAGYRLDNIEFVKTTGTEEYLSCYLRRCGFALRSATRYVLGRFVADCAVVGIPSIGSPHFFQEKLFPELTLYRGSIAEVKDKIALLEDEDKIREIVEYAREAVEEFRPERFGVRFIDIAGG